MAAQVSFREQMAAVKAAWKTEKPQPEFLFRTMQAYPHTPKFLALLADGWEVVSSSPVILAGCTLKQSLWQLRKRNPDYAGPTS